MFNEDGAVNVNQSVFTARNDPNMQAFNPYTETPVEGVHWRKGANFGKPLAVADLQLPRTYTVSLGVRF